MIDNTEVPDLVAQPTTENAVPDLVTPTSPVLPDKVLNDRAQRADFALGDQSPGQPALKDAFLRGQEPAVRSTTAANTTAEFQQAKLDKVREISQSGVPLDDKTVNGLMDIAKTPAANPDTVFEDKFAKRYTDFATIGDPGKNLVFQSAFEKQPEQTQRDLQTGTAMVSRALQAKNFYEELKTAHDALPWFGGDDGQQDKSGDLIKSMLTMGYREKILQRNLLMERPENSLLPGSNKLEQIQYLYLLHQNDFLPALKAVAGPGSDLWKRSPAAALDFAKSAVAFSTSDAYVDDTMALIDVATLFPGGSMLKQLNRFRNGTELPRSALATADQVLRQSSKPPVTAGQKGADTAFDVLSQSSKAPEPGYYIPEGAYQRSYEGQPRIGSVTVDAKGQPIYQTADGAYVDLLRTPEVGSIPLKVEKGEPVPTYYTSRGNQPYTTAEGTTTVEGKQTIFADKKGYEKLSQVLDEDKNYQILQDPKLPDRYFVANETGREVRGSRVKVSHEPGEGLFPIHLNEGTDKIRFEDFGARITRVDQNNPFKVTLGPQIAEREAVETKKAVADIVKSIGETHPQDALTKMGQADTAAKQQAASDIADRMSDIVPKTDAENIRRNLPSLFSPQLYFHNASSLSTELKNRLIERALKSVNEISAALMNPQRVERLTKEAFDRAVQQAQDLVKRTYNRASDAIIDQQTHWDAASNTYWLETKFAKKDGSLFDNSASAEFHRTLQYRLGSAGEVKQEGNKFYISHIQHLDETLRPVRDGLIVGSETPRGFWNSLLNAVTGKVTGGFGYSVRSARYTSSDFVHSQRVVSTHAPSVLRKAIEDTSAELGAMSKAERQDLERVLEANRDYMSPTGERGQFYKSAHEFEQGYYAIHNTLPSPKQVAAYDQFTRLSDLDWMLRALQLHRDKARMNIRNYRVDVMDPAGAKVKTDFFEGKRVENFDPVNTQDANIYVAPEGRFTHKFDKTVDDAIMMKNITEGKWQVIQLYNPRSKPLKATTGIKDDVHFVVTDKFDDTATKLGQGLDYNPGGHVIYQDPYFMKVPMIGKGTKGRDTHFGDTSMKTFATEREGKEWINKYNIAREHLRNNRDVELQRMFDSGAFPETLNEFKQWYTPGGFDLNAEHPFVLTTAGRDTFQSSEELAKAYPGLKDQFSSYNLSQIQNTDFLAERNQQLNTIANQGTELNPHYVHVPSKLYDPYTSLQKGMAQIVRERWMGDAKTSMAEQWVAEFWHLFDQSKLPRAKLEQNPTYWLYHAEGNLDMGLGKTNPELLTAAMVSRRNILSFLGARDEIGSVLQGMEQLVINSLEGKLGAKIAGKVEETILPAIKEAPQYARAATFHAMIGMFNPVQLFQQGMGMAHAIAISPIHGVQGVTASALARLYRYTENPAILSSMFDKAVAMGWRRGEIEEAWDAWKSTGSHNIAGETATLNHIDDPKLFRDGANRFLDKGLMFFKAGESIVRDTAFFTAYRDWRAANPTAVMNNRAKQDIMNRFDTLSMNMTRASNASYNEGILSFPTQYWTWNARFTEQMLGRQLTWAEKGRVLATYSALFGVPSTLGGITFGVIPGANYSDIRQYALVHAHELGFNISDKWYQAFSEGLPAMLTNMITGHETDFHRFSPDATQMKDILDGKKDAYHSIIGASGTFVENVAHTLYPFGKFAWETLKGQGSKFPLKGNDLLNVMENISVLSNAEKAIVALNTGKLYTRKEGLVDNKVDTFDSFMLTLGLPPKKAADAFTKMEYNKELKNVQTKLKPDIQENFKLGLQAAARGDHEAMYQFMTRANTLSSMADLDVTQQVELFNQSFHGTNTSLVDQAEMQFRAKAPNLQKIPGMREYLKRQAQ